MENEKFSFEKLLEQIFPAVKLKFKKITYFWPFRQSYQKYCEDFPKNDFVIFGLKSTSFEDSSASENEPKMDLRTKIFEASKISEASLQH